MKAPENENSKPLPLAPTGTCVARCYRVMDLGTQEGYVKGEFKRRIKLTFELSKMHDFGHGLQPFAVSKEFNFTMGSHNGRMSALRESLNSWRGKNLTDQEAFDFDFSKLLGVYALVNIIHSTSENGKTNPKIASISPVPDEMNKPEPFNDGICFSLDEYTEELFNKLDKYTQDKIKQSPEYKTITKAVL